MLSRITGVETVELHYQDTYKLQGIPQAQKACTTLCPYNQTTKMKKVMNLTKVEGGVQFLNQHWGCK